MALLKQIVSGVVTAENQSSGIVGLTTTSKEIVFPISFDDNKKHYQIVSYTISFANNNATMLSPVFYKEDISTWKLNDISKNQAFSGGVEMNKGSLALFVRYPYKTAGIKPYNRNGYGQVDSIISSTNCVLNYGSLLTPIVQSNVSNSFVDYRKEFKLSFSTKIQSNMFEQFSIISGIFKYREKGTTGSYAQISFIGNQATIQSNTFTNGKVYECYATCTVDDNQVSDSPMIELTTIDTKPTLTCIKPKNEITYGEVFFDWNYDNQTGVEQYAFDLQYSTDNLTWVDLDVHTVSNITQATHAVPAGDLFWRVRGYNQNDVASEWSTSAKFINVAKPTKPVITEIQSSGMPTIKWSSENQIAFEIEVDGLWKSRQVYTTNKFYKLEDYLPNGNYHMRLRIYNQYAQFSDWLEFDYSQNMNVNQPQATITETLKGFNIKIKNDLSIMTYYLLRNGIPIHKFIDLEYEDIYVNGDVLYTIRAVDFQGNFADLTLPVKRDKKEVVLIDLQGNIYDLGTNIGDWTKIEKSTIKDRQDVSYLGRSKPVIINGDLEYSQWSIGAVFKDLPLGEILFYRDFSGTGAWVMAHNIGSTINKYYIQSSTVLREVSYDGRIEY